MCLCRQHEQSQDDIFGNTTGSLEGCIGQGKVKVEIVESSAARLYLNGLYMQGSVTQELSHCTSFPFITIKSVQATFFPIG